MPEGHTVHRTAKRLQRDFAGEDVIVSSPQGRFSDAALVSGQKLKKVEAWGKQMFMHFPSGIIRIHLGIYGKWSFQKLEGQVPDPRGAVRARFLNDNFLADLRGPTACELIDSDQLQELTRKLGPDPLRFDTGGAAEFAQRVQSSKRPLGVLLMDQSILAGVGNVYRAELLFRNSLSPFVPGNSVATESLVALWEDCTKLMPIGVRTGLMLTREGYLKGRPSLVERYYVYKRQGLPCRNCGGAIALELMATRKLYWCPKCQA